MQIAITDLRQTLCETLNRIHYGQEAAVVTKRGKAFVVIVPIVGILNEHTNITDLITALVTSADQEAVEDKTDQQ